jgi:hypothetical protein
VRVLEGCAIAALVSMAGFFSAGTYAVLDLHHRAVTTSLVPAVSAALAPTLAKVNEDLDEAHRLTLEAGLTAMDARKASAEELKALPALTQGIQTTVASSSAALLATRDTAVQVGLSAQEISTSATQLLSASTATVSGLQPVEQQATASLEALNSATTRLDALLADPSIAKSADNIESITASGKEFAADSAFELHKFVHPDKVKLGFWGTIDGGLLWAHSHVIPPLF